MDLIPKELQSKKCPAFEPVSKDFNIKWNNILWDAQRNLVELLHNDLDLELKRVYPKNYENKHLRLDQNH